MEDNKIWFEKLRGGSSVVSKWFWGLGSSWGDRGFIMVSFVILGGVVQHESREPRPVKEKLRGSVQVVLGSSWGDTKFFDFSRWEKLPDEVTPQVVLGSSWTFIIFVIGVVVQHRKMWSGLRSAGAGSS